MPGKKNLLSVNLSNPLLAYTAIWGVVIYLLGLQLTTNIIDFTTEAYIFVGTTILSFFIIYYLVKLLSKKKKRTLEQLQQDLPALRSFAGRLLKIWMTGTLLEVAINGGFPMIWVLVGANKGYADFGIPSIHGFLNAFYLFCLSSYTLLYMVGRDKKDRRIMLLLLLFPVFIFSRAILVYALMQMIAIYLFFNRVTVKRLVVMSVLFLVFIYVFGVIGDNRLAPGETTLIEQFINPEYQDLFAKVPSGFIWVYIYVTCSLNNVVYSLPDLAPTYTAYYTVVNLFPSVIRQFLYTNIDKKYPLDMVIEVFNTFTIYGGSLGDFGIAGGIIFGIIFQLTIVVIYFKARRFHLWGILAYSILFQTVLTSAFTDSFTSLPIIMQVVLALIFNRYLKKRRKKEAALHTPAAS